MSSFTPMNFLPTSTIPRILTIAGSDSGGGAGIQADLKSIAAHGGYGLSAITSLTAQNTRGVQDILTPPAQFLKAQLQAISDDIDIDGVKIGMLGSKENVVAVQQWLCEHRAKVVVLDPVMVSTSGHRLVDDDAQQALHDLAAEVDLITPNAYELALLAGEEVCEDFEELLAQGQRVVAQLKVAVLVKGGHSVSDVVTDALVVPEASAPLWRKSSARVTTTSTHGTGCSLSAALTTLLARTGDWQLSLDTAKNWIDGAITHGHELKVGSGHGPIHHFYHVQSHLIASLSNAAEDSLTQSLRADFSATVWDLSAKIRQQILEHPFVQGLGDGSLDTDAFTDYLYQDAHYLNQYSRALAIVSSYAPFADAQIFFAESAASAIAVESELHREWTHRYPEAAERNKMPSATTQEYTDFLLAQAHQGFAVGAAAVLPCYWLYAHIGEDLLERADASFATAAEHPFREWLNTYSAEDFQIATKSAINFVDKIAQTARFDELHAMKNAFMRACQLELEFFDAPLRRVTCSN